MIPQPTRTYVRGERVAWRVSLAWGDTLVTGTVVYVHSINGIPTPANDAYWSDVTTYAPFLRYVVRWDDGMTTQAESVSDLVPEPYVSDWPDVIISNEGDPLLTC